MNEENHQHVVDLSFSKKQHVGKSMDSRPAVLKKNQRTGFDWCWVVLYFYAELPVLALKLNENCLSSSSTCKWNQEFSSGFNSSKTIHVPGY